LICVAAALKVEAPAEVAGPTRFLACGWALKQVEKSGATAQIQSRSNDRPAMQINHIKPSQQHG